MAALKAWQQWRTFWNVVSWPIGALLALGSWVVRLTVRVYVHGDVPPEPCVFVSWHRHVPYMLIHHGRARRWQLMSPAPYLLPIVRWSQLLGVRSLQAPFRGRLRDAFPQLVHLLQAGASCAVYVDGPAGPPRQAKVGCIEVARAAGVPMVPIAYRTQLDAGAFWRWDQALFALPFERVDVYVGKAMAAASGSDTDAQIQAIGAALDALDAGS